MTAWMTEERRVRIVRHRKLETKHWNPWNYHSNPSNSSDCHLVLLLCPGALTARLLPELRRVEERVRDSDARVAAVASQNAGGFARA
jgi:hypothetical protein